MPSTAISAQGSKLYIGGTAGGAKTITGVAVGNPTILTSAAHGFQNGDYVTFDSNFAGANAADLNGKSVVVRNRTTNTFAIEIDTTGRTITAGTAQGTAAAWTQVKNVTSIKGIDGSAKEIDTTNLDSTAIEMLLGLPDNGSLAVEVDGDPADAGQAAVQTARDDVGIRTFKWTLPSGALSTATFNGYVKKFDRSSSPNDKVKRMIDIRISGAVTWS